MSDSIVVSTRIPVEDYARLNGWAVMERKSVGEFLRDFALRVLEPTEQRSEES